MSFPDALGPVVVHRRPLARSATAIARGSLTVGFLGGSITAPKTGTRWPEPFAGWLLRRFPGLRLTIENAALGATGSDLGVFRAQPEVIARGADLVFVEYAVNDDDQPTERRNRTREGLLRQLVAAGCDVVLVHTFRPEMLADMEQGRAPASIAEFEALAAHYGAASVWAGLKSWLEVRRGLMSWHDWLPDGLHPEARGSLSYAEAVVELCEAEWGGAESADTPAAAGMPAPLYPDCWDRVCQVGLDAPALEGPWTLRNWQGCLGMPRALHCTAPGAGLSLAFEGRGLLLGFDFGRLSGEVRHRVDGGPWHATLRDRPAWCGDGGWFRPLVVADHLAPGRHVLELETLAARIDGGIGSVTTLGLIGLIL